MINKRAIATQGLVRDKISMATQGFRNTIIEVIVEVLRRGKLIAAKMPYKYLMFPGHR